MPLRPSAPSRPWAIRALQGAWRLLFPALAVVAACSLPADEASAQPGIAASKEVERALVDLLARRPELVRNAMDELQRREAVARDRQSRQALKTSAAAILDPADAIVLGNPAGDVTLVEFIDYHCGYCKRLSLSIDELVRRDGRLRVLVKHLPILGPESIAAAQLAGAAACAQDANQCAIAILNMTNSVLMVMANIATAGEAGEAKNAVMAAKNAYEAAKALDALQQLLVLENSIEQYMSMAESNLASLSTPAIADAVAARYRKGSPNYRFIARSWASRQLLLFISDTTLKVDELMITMIDPTQVSGVVVAFVQPICSEHTPIPVY